MGFSSKGRRQKQRERESRGEATRDQRARLDLVPASKRPKSTEWFSLLPLPLGIFWDRRGLCACLLCTCTLHIHYNNNNINIVIASLLLFILKCNPWITITRSWVWESPISPIYTYFPKLLRSNLPPLCRQLLVQWGLNLSQMSQRLVCLVQVWVYDTSSPPPATHSS